MKTTKTANLCIPSCGRPHKLENLLQSIKEEDWNKINKVLIVNTTPSHQEDILKEYADICLKYKLESIFLPWAGPSEARLKGSEYLNNHMPKEYIMFLDDDLTFRGSNLTEMVSFLDANLSVKLCSAAWVDHRKDETSDRPLGYKYIKSIKNSLVIINKLSISKEQFKSDVVYVDDAQASILVRSTLFEYLNFDAEYEFFMELFDFFYSLYINNIPCAVLTNVIFDHFPGDYQTGSQKRNANIKRNKAVDYFKRKWGVVPYTFA